MSMSRPSRFAFDTCRTRCEITSLLPCSTSSFLQDTLVVKNSRDSHSCASSRFSGSSDNKLLPDSLNSSLRFKFLRKTFSMEDRCRKMFNFDIRSSSQASLFFNFNPLSGTCDLKFRSFSVVSTGDSDCESDEDAEECENGCENKGSTRVDPEEVSRVCNIIEELFALDRNMEAVLDESRVNPSHDLVIDVLERFRHARKPAHRFFNWAKEKPGYSPDSTTYNKMMEVLGRCKQFETMLALIEEMGEKKLLTMDTFMIAIKAFAGGKERKKAVGLFGLMKKFKFKVGVTTINILLDSLGRAKLGREAQALFQKLKGRFTPDICTYAVLLNGWCRVKNLMEAGRIWNEMIDTGFKPDIVAYNTMLEGLFKCHKRSDAIKLFEVMKAKGPQPNVRSYAILIKQFCKQVRMNEAVECFNDMLASGCHPDSAVYTCLIKGFGNKKQMGKVCELLMEMKDKGCLPDGRTYNALIKLMTNRRMADDAVRVYKDMIQSGIKPTIHTYNMMMKLYFEMRNYEMASRVWEEMNQNGCCPDDNSYTVLIGGLVRLDRSDEACKYLEEMIEKGMKVPQIDYNKFAADFSRAGRPDVLEELAQKTMFVGKFEVFNTFARWGEMMKKRVKRRFPTKGANDWD